MSPVRTFGADRGRKSALWAKYRPRSARFLRTRDATPLDPRRNASGPAPAYSFSAKRATWGLASIRTRASHQRVGRTACQKTMLEAPRPGR